MIPTILDTLLRWFPRLVRLRYRLQLIRNSADELNRRVTVEQQLLDAAAGKRPLPDAAECRRLALQLGVPADFNRRERGQVPPKAPPPPRDEHEAFPGDAGSAVSREPLNAFRDPSIANVGFALGSEKDGSLTSIAEILVRPLDIRTDESGEHGDEEFVLVRLTLCELLGLADAASEDLREVRAATGDRRHAPT